MNIIKKVYDFYQSYSGEKGVIGYTEQGRPIPFMVVKKTQTPKIIVTYSIHAREYITSFLALLQIENFIKHGKVGSVYFLPMINVDGVKICLERNPLYKANANGVDLNVNFDAGWGTGEKNVITAGSENYIGSFPFSEKESVAVRDFTLKICPHATVSYHAKGEEIYWDFNQNGKRRARDLRLAKLLALTTGYQLKSTPNSAGGYKDWCVEKLKISAFTIEVGREELSHPLCSKYLPEIYIKNANVLRVLTENIKEEIW